MLSIPDDPELADQTLVIVNAPDHLLSVAMMWPMRLLEGMTMPQRLRGLATQGAALEIARVDERTLKIGFEYRLYSTALDWMFRGPDRPLETGQVVELDGMSVEVTEVTAAGEPLEVLFRFDRPLEDSSLRWVRWDDGVFIPFSPPPPGVTVKLPVPRGPFS